MGCLLSKGYHDIEGDPSTMRRPSSPVPVTDLYVNRQVSVETHKKRSELASNPVHRSAKSERIERTMSSTAVPWKANVFTTFGPGQVTKIARREDGITEVTLTEWRLANNATVKIYSPTFIVKSHHRRYSTKTK